jgi:hypothetical protein
MDRGEEEEEEHNEGNIACRRSTCSTLCPELCPQVDLHIYLFFHGELGGFYVCVLELEEGMRFRG